MPAFTTLRIDPDPANPRIARLLLNRPERLNAVDAQAEGFKAAVQWRDSGKPIPEGDEARALVREMEARSQAERKQP